PLRKLPVKEQPEPFAEHQPPAAPAEFRPRSPCEVDQIELTLAARKAFHCKFEPRGAGVFDGGDAPGKIAGAVPSLNRKPFAAHVGRELFPGQCKNFFARLEQRRLAAIFEETLIRRQVLSRGGHRSKPL